MTKTIEIKGVQHLKETLEKLSEKTPAMLQYAIDTKAERIMQEQMAMFQRMSIMYELSEYWDRDIFRSLGQPRK